LSVARCSKNALAILCGLVLAACASLNSGRSELTVYDSADRITAACNTAIERAGGDADAIRRLPLDAVAVDNVLAAWDDLNMRLEDAIGPIYLQAYVHPDTDIRTAGEECILAYNRFETGLFQDAELHERVTAVAARDPVDAELRRDLLESFEDTGAALPPEKRARAKELLERIKALGQRFQRNLRDNDEVMVFPEAALRGLPKSYLARVTRREDGGIEVGFDYPEYYPFMAHAESGTARERYYRAFVDRGGDANIERLRELTVLRKELAGLYGLPDYTHYVMRRRMVETPATVYDFLARVDTEITPPARRQVAALAALKAEHLGVESAELYPWDKSFYLERLRRQRYDVDQEALRRFFPMPQTTDWVLGLAADLYGLRFVPARASVWHESVTYYEIRDAESDRFVGGLYLDLYPRAGKYGHAAAFAVHGASTRAGRAPTSVLVTNFERTGLTPGEVETYLHEIGHALHNIVSTTRYSLHSGTQVALDFVEAPSQMFEEWARRPETLARIAEVCPECPRIDRDLVARLNAARRLDRPLFYSRQLLYARYDLALTEEDPPDPLTAWAAMEDASPLGHVPGTRFPSSFGHIAGDYAAGYYGYMWSEALALDMVGVWGDDLMDPAVGRRFREKVLARGGELPAARLVRDFLGREPRPDAFFAEIRGARK
jgi:thimet oligopeptidase